MSTSASRLPPLSPGGKVNSSIPTFHRQNSASRLAASNGKYVAEVTRWKHKFEDVEQKRKVLLSDNVRLSRKNEELQKKNVDLQETQEQLETELFEKNEEYLKLSTASKNLYKEYETLRNQYDVETGAMSSALKDASQWYKQNRELKRRTLLLEKDCVDEGVDTGETTPDHDIENLNRTIRNLSAQVARLQTEVECLKQQEFNTNEENIRLSEELEKEKIHSAKINLELINMKKDHEQLLRISEMMKKEIKDLRDMEESSRNDVVVLRKEAKGYKKERNVLAHQSTLLLKGISADNVENCMLLLQEIEQLKRDQEEERMRYEEELNALQEKLEDQSNSSQVEVLEERLKLVESELQTALERAEKAEKALDEGSKIPQPPPPPPAPLPPPPPPLPFAGPPPVVPLRVKRKSKTNLEIPELNIESDDKKAISAPGVNDDIINAIKEGKFTLKKTKSESKRDKESSSKTVSEILNILGSLKRAPKKRQSFIMDKN